MSVRFNYMYSKKNDATKQNTYPTMFKNKILRFAILLMLKFKLIK